MSDVDQINALSQVIRRVDGNHTMGAGALAEAILDRRTEWDTPRIIRTVKELEALDPDTVVWDSAGDLWHAGDYLLAEDPHTAIAYYSDDLPAVVIRDGSDVRAARKALEEA